MADSSPIPDRDAIVRQLRLKRANHEWLNQHRDELRRRFPDKYVAVLDERVAGAEAEFPRLLARLRKEFPDQDPSVAAVDFLSREDLVWVL